MSWTQHRAPWPTPTTPEPPGCFTYGHLWAVGNICETAACKRQDIIIALFIALVLSVGMRWVVPVAAESQTLV